jgi:hypothetical protein
MEKKQTAVQEIMSIVEMDYNNGVEISMKVFYGMLQNALIKEREQIEEAYEQGYSDSQVEYAGSLEEGKIYFTDFKHYYNETFKP